MIPDLLPAPAIGVEAYEPRWDTTLLSEEQVLVERAVSKRKREFAAARNCARRALVKLGQSAGPILAGPKREPIWPTGVVGSITHCSGYCAAAVAYQDAIWSLGIDAERNAPLSDDLVDLVATGDELAALRSQLAGQMPGGCAAMLLFSAKESIYKGWYPIARSWLGFHDAVVHLDAPQQRFTAELKPGTSNDALASQLRFEGRFALTRDHIFTTVIVKIFNNT